MKIIIIATINTDEGEINFKSRRYEINNRGEINETLMNMAEDIQFQIENNHSAKYNLIVDKISKITIHYDRFNPTRAGSYIEAPEWIKNKKACINIKNEDNKCFKYAVQCGVLEIYKKRPSR